MSADEEIDRSLIEFAQKIAAIPKRIADEDRSAESPAEAALTVSPPHPRSATRTCLPRFPPTSSPIRTFDLLRPPAQSANRFVTPMNSQASS
jgi:hypothetical protein